MKNLYNLQCTYLHDVHCITFMFTILGTEYINEHLKHINEVPTKFIIFYQASLNFQIFFL